MGIGLLLCGYCVVVLAPNFRFDAIDLATICGAAAFVILSYALLLVGEPASDVRSLWFASTQQLMVIVLLLFFRNFQAMRAGLLYVLSAFLVLQFCLSATQYTFYEYGIGLPIRFAEYQERLFVAGPYINANDNSMYAVGLLVGIIALHKSSQKQFILPLAIGMSGAIVWLSLSRSMLLVYFVLALLAMTEIHRTSRSQVRSSSSAKATAGTILVCLVTTLILGALVKTESGVGDRSLQRTTSILQTTDDKSVQIRLLPYLRLPRVLANPWGTFEDLNYSAYFDPDDEPIMQVNPHSLIAETTFLYGLLGLVSCLAMLSAVSVGILSNDQISLGMRLAVVGALLVSQSVSSSLLAAPLFLAPYVLAMKMRRVVPIVGVKRFISLVRRQTVSGAAISA